MNITHRLLAWLFIAACLATTVQAAQPSPLPMSSPSPSASPSGFASIASLYAVPLARILKQWSQNPPSVWFGPAEPIAVRALETPHNSTYIGLAEFEEIHAPLSRVAGILEDYGNYPKLFDDLVRVEVRGRQGKQFVVFTQQGIPVPFVPDETNEMVYQIDSTNSGQKSYLYALRKSNHLKFNDGFILLTQVSENTTAYFELDFWDADWGFIKSFGDSRIWAGSIRALAQADLAIKLRAENPGWEPGRAKKESAKWADRLDARKIYQSRIPVEKLMSVASPEPMPSPLKSESPKSEEEVGVVAGDIETSHDLEPLQDLVGYSPGPMKSTGQSFPARIFVEGPHVKRYSR